MGSKVSKPTTAEPQLYAVATPHPATLQYIYPVYAAPIDLATTETKKGSTRRKSESRQRSKIKVFTEKAGALVATAPAQDSNPNVAEDEQAGQWFHYHVDETGAVDYVQPGTSIPQHLVQPAFVNAQFGSPISPSISMMGTPFEASAHSYPAVHGYPVYQSAHPILSPQPQQWTYTPPLIPRARSVSPKRTRALTPTGKPRRASTPTPKQMVTPTYEPAPPMPEYIKPVGRRPRTATPFPKIKALPRAPSDTGSGSRRSRRSSQDEETEEASTAIGVQLDLFPPVPTSTSRSRPYSPTPPSDMSSLGRLITSRRTAGGDWQDSVYSGSSKP